jgi:1-acyl-sn-glycerol-3-phosphate acyltransferase
MRSLAARLFLRLTGWQAEGGRPTLRKFVLITAPHTSNWDLAYMLALSVIFRLKVSWMGKHTLFRPPQGWILRRLGGIPIRRHRQGNMVEQMTQAFAASDSLVLAVPAEATRGYTPYWKSGFYHIARAAGVPVVLGFLDYARRRGGLGPAMVLSGDVRQDMNEIRAFYEDKTAKYPDQFGEVRLKEEM